MSDARALFYFNEICVVSSKTESKSPKNMKRKIFFALLQNLYLFKYLHTRKYIKRLSNTYVKDKNPFISLNELEK